MYKAMSSTRSRVGDGLKRIGEEDRGRGTRGTLGPLKKWLSRPQRLHVDMRWAEVNRFNRYSSILGRSN